MTFSFLMYLLYHKFLKKSTFQHICTSKLTAPHFLTIGMCTSDGKLHHLSLCCKILIKDSNLGFRGCRRTSYYTNKALCSTIFPV